MSSNYDPLLCSHTNKSPVELIKARNERLRFCRGCPQRDVQTCKRNDRSCYENASAGFCPAGMFGETVGTWPSGYHNEPLYRETLAAPPPEPDPFWGEPVVHLGVHLWPVIHHDEPRRPWVEQIALWHELAEELNGRLIVGVATGPNTATFAEVEEYFGERFELVEIPNDEVEGENPTFRKLLEVLPSGPEDVLIYCHSKGVQAARRNSEAVQLWRELLYETVAFNWRRGVKKLAEGYKAFGAFRAFTTSRNVIPHGWYYSGTFFVGRLKWFRDAAGLPLPVSPIWGGVEHFLGTHFPARECWCDFADGRDLEQDYHISRMFPAIVHDGFRWEMERLERAYGVHCEQHVRELEWLLGQIEPGDRVLVIGSRAGGIESILKKRVEGVTTVSIDPEPLPENPHTLIIGSSHDAEVQFQARALGGFDVIFIDGDHTEDGVREDWAFAQKLQPRLVVFHDIADTTFHRSLECNVAPLWAEIKATHATDEMIVGGGWGGIGVVDLQEKLEHEAEDRAAAQVSIVITVGPGYEKFAAKAIESATRQGRIGEVCELIVVWDGVKIPLDVPGWYYELRGWMYEVDFRNVQKARRFGVEKARGRYTLFLDADDWLPDGFVASAVEQLRAAEAFDHRVAGIYPAAEYVDLATGEIRDRVPARPWDRTLFDAANFVVISTLVRTEELRNAKWGGSDMRTLEDHAMWLSVIDRGLRLAPGVDLTLNVGVHDDSLSRNVVFREYAELHAIAEKPVTIIFLSTGKRDPAPWVRWFDILVDKYTQDIRFHIIDTWDDEPANSRNLENGLGLYDKRCVDLSRFNGDEIVIGDPMEALNQAIQEAQTPLVWILDEDIMPQINSIDALKELAAGFEADVGAVCGLTGSRAVAPDQRFAAINGSGFSCVLARTRILQEAGPIYAATPVEPWPDRRFWEAVQSGGTRVRVANRVPCAHVDRRLEILTYHEVDPENPSAWSISPELLRDHLTWLRANGWRFRTLDESLLQYGPAEKSVVITFDDGRLGCWDHAKPILDEFGIKAAFFICPQMTDGAAAENQRYTEFMSWEQIVELAEAGHTIGNHAAEHVRLGDLPADNVRSLMTLGKLLVEESSGVIQCDHFAAPYGSTSGDVELIAREIGHRTVLTTKESGNDLPVNPFWLCRRQIKNGTTVEQLAAMLGGVN